MAVVGSHYVALEIIETKLAIHVRNKHILRVSCEPTSTNSAGAPAFSRQCLDAHGLVRVPQPHIAIICPRHNHCAIKGHIQGRQWLWMGQQFLYHFVLPYVPQEEKVISASGEQQILLVIEETLGDE